MKFSLNLLLSKKDLNVVKTNCICIVKLLNTLLNNVLKIIKLQNNECGC